LLILNLSLWLYCITEPIYWLFLHPLDIPLYMVFWEINDLTWQYRKLQVMFKVSPTSLQTFIDTPNCVLKDYVQYSMVHIPNVFCNSHLLNHQFCTVIIRCTETFWSPCMLPYTHLSVTIHYDDQAFTESVLQITSEFHFSMWLVGSSWPHLWRHTVGLSMIPLTSSKDEI
jgi:hypothetical protein